MIPLKDDNPTQTFPLVTIVIIGFNILVYLYQLTLSAEGLEYFILRYGAIPGRLIHPLLQDYSSGQTIPYALTIFSSMFIHGGLIHLLGNMLYLWVFGNNVEDYLGHVKFIIFYLISGFFAAFIHTLSEINSPIPMIGASGAIAGILGAYLVLFPRANVSTLFIFIIFFKIIKVPAVLILGLWFLFQLLNAGSGGGSVAWYAHVGGFITGIILIRAFRPFRKN
ncbi:MAG: rhomboid family intramembrane serine protease [Deltaproteobacteria bacterium RBG_13_43_22]|jgi:membrane associated rhomboid family serine protease|nr:MAG: rhomboid family intramembrane serine protease [Deltaproteobacteria bacterium RBG_13_43_22]